MAQSKHNGSHFALTAIGVGMLVLGIVMAVWNIIPSTNGNDTSTHGTSSTPQNNGNVNIKSKTFSVAYVLIGSGIALLLVAVCLSFRNKKRRPSMQDVRVQQEESRDPQANGESQEIEAPRYSAPSYDEVMRIGYNGSDPTVMERQDRLSINLPSYESLTELDDETPTRPNAGSAKGAQPDRTDSRSGKEKKPLNVRRIKSDKLHLKEFRLNLSGESKRPPTQSIEPLTPPPQYEDKPLGKNEDM